MFIFGDFVKHAAPKRLEGNASNKKGSNAELVFFPKAREQGSCSKQRDRAGRAGGRHASQLRMSIKSIKPTALLRLPPCCAACPWNILAGKTMKNYGFCKPHLATPFVWATSFGHLWTLTVQHAVQLLQTPQPCEAAALNPPPSGFGTLRAAAIDRTRL